MDYQLIMARYKIYNVLQRYENSIPVEPPEYKKGELITSDYFDSIEDCENTKYYVKWVLDEDKFYCGRDHVSYHMERLTYSKDNLIWLDSEPPVYRNTSIIFEDKEVECIEIRESEIIYKVLNPFPNGNNNVNIYVNNNTYTFTPSSDNNIHCDYYKYNFEERLRTMRFFDPETSMVTNSNRFITEIYADIDTASITEINNMVSNVQSTNLSKIYLKNFNCNNVTSIERMFYHQVLLTDITLEDFNPTKLKSLKEMFVWTPIEILDLSNVTCELDDFNNIVDHCQNLKQLIMPNIKIDLNKTNKNGNKYIATSCYGLEYVDISNVKPNTTNTSYNDIFYLCPRINHIKCTQEFKDVYTEKHNTDGIYFEIV